MTYLRQCLEEVRAVARSASASDLLPLPLVGEGRGEGAALQVQPSVPKRRALTPALSRAREREFHLRSQRAPCQLAKPWANASPIAEMRRFSRSAALQTNEI
jgi:hypothetical protein